MIDSPLLSVVVLNYNYGKYLPGCLQSILDQTFTDFEVIVIDDRSTDDSLKILQPFLSDPRVRLHAHQVNAGFSKSLIEGTEELSHGAFRTVISADDIVRRRDAFETQIGLLRAHPTAAFCFSAVECFRTSTPNDIHRHDSFASETVLGPAAALRALLNQKGVWPLHSGTIIRTSAYEASARYRRDITMPLDLAIWLSLSMQGGFAYSPLALHGYRVHEGQMSAAPAKIRRNTQEVALILREACREGERRGLGTGRLLRSAIINHLGAAALSDAFAGSRRVAAHRWLAAVREHPVETLTSPALWSVALRVAFGETGFRLGRRAFRRAKERSFS